MIGSIEVGSPQKAVGRSQLFRRAKWTLSRTCRCTPLLLIATFAAAARSGDAPVTDETVEAAIVRAVDWLESQRNERGHWERSENTEEKYWAGNSALALLALLYAGQDARETDMAASLEWLADQPMKTTYTRGVRAHVFALVPGRKYHRQLVDDLGWLVDAIHPAGEKHSGAYGYFSVQETRDSWYDNSNSQFGVLGVWTATEAGARVDRLREYWKLVEDHWLEDQQSDGGWNYRGGGNSTGSMTAAGLATLHVVLDHVHAGTGHKQADDVISAIERGLGWFGEHFTTENPYGSGQWKYYYLYGVERVGRASGRKYFRRRDWFRIGAAKLLALQRKDGSWKNDLRDTCFALMFLSHGRAPLLFNKLQYGDDWNNYLRDVAGLTRYSEHVFERLMNWQIVPLDGPLEDLLEAPVLYMSGQASWEFDEEQVERLREYCLRGGMILAVVQKHGEQFASATRSLARRLFPEQQLRRLPVKHPLFDGEVQFAISDPPKMYEIHNGVRTLLLLADKDISSAWNRYQVSQKQRDFRIGCNVYVYATDKSTIRSRLQTTTITPEQVDVKRIIEVARLKHAGGWDVEPYGWTRLSAYMNNSCATRLVVKHGVALDRPELERFRVAHITGTRAFAFTAEEFSGLRLFLAGGGTLLADAAGGSTEFIESLEDQLSDLLDTRPRRLSPESAILTGQGLTDAVSLDEVGYRRAVRRPGRGRRLPPLSSYDLGKRSAVIYSPLDISVGLLGTEVYDCRGYTPDSALRVMRNMLLYADLSTAEKIRLTRE